MFKLGEHFPFTRSDNKAKIRACISEQTKWSVQGGKGGESVLLKLAMLPCVNIRSGYMLWDYQQPTYASVFHDVK